MEGSDNWNNARWEAFDQDRWMLIQELGYNYYMLYENNYSKKEDEEKTSNRLEWKEEEEKAKEEYFRMIAEEDKRGYKRQTVAELIKDRSADKQKERES